MISLPRLPAIVALLFLAIACCLAKEKEDTSNPIVIELGKTIERTIDQVRADKGAYGPKQEFIEETKETHVWLPYGKNPKFYNQLKAKIFDVEMGEKSSGAQAHTPADSKTNLIIGYKLVFTKPIKQFRFEIRYLEADLTTKTAIGVEYSLNGKKWFKIEHMTGDELKATSGCLGQDLYVKGLSTNVLFVRVYAREDKDHEHEWGDNRWFKVAMSGDANWGDAATTFFRFQPQLWVR